MKGGITLGTENEGLTDAQVERQDLVDNLCHKLLNDLAGASIAHHEGFLVEWDIEQISAVREAVQEVIVDKLHLMTEQEFYPYIEQEAQPIDCKNTCGNYARCFPLVNPVLCTCLERKPF
jgi:hypothetical protein